MAKKTAKPTQNEKDATAAGKTVKEWNAAKKKGSGGSSSGNTSVADMVKSILGATPAQQAVKAPFEDTYTPALEAEDLTQSEALYKPYFEKQIANELEDLNAWTQTEGVSYERSLRRARFSLAAAGGAIGTERDTQEGEITQDKNTRAENAIRGTERNVGTDAIVNGGFQSATGTPQEGAIVGKMKSAVQEGQLWYKNQRANRYYGDSKVYYAQPSPYALDGSKM